MDEVPLYFDMCENRTYDLRGSKHVLVNSTGYDHFRFTVVLAFMADGRKLKPMIIFKNLIKPPKINFIPNCVVRASKSGTMDSKLMIDWINEVWLKRPGNTLFKSNHKSLLIYDSARGHIVDEVKNYLKNECETKIAVIPGGCTPLLQPGDVAIHRSFKTKVKELYLNWLCKEKVNASELTKNKKRKRAAYSEIVKWIDIAWAAIENEKLKNSFKLCGITSSNYDDYNHLLKHFVSKQDHTEYFLEEEYLGSELEPSYLTDEDSDNDNDI